MCKFSSKSGGVPFQISFFLGDLTRNDPKWKFRHPKFKFLPHLSNLVYAPATPPEFCRVWCACKIYIKTEATEQHLENTNFHKKREEILSSY